MDGDKINNMECIDALITRGFFSMAFQPIVDAVTTKPFGFEALLRGPVGTPLANPCSVFGQESCLGSELLTKLDLACIGSAARTGRFLASDFKLFININGLTVKKLSPGMFMGLLSELRIDPGCIVFEISERTDQDHIKELAMRLEAFRDFGVKVALDDVGVQYPWLLHMLWLEPDFVKIDRALVQGIDAHKKKQDLVQGLALLSDRMDAMLVAEGIETIQEHEALKGLGVPLVQGYHYGRPQPASKWMGLHCTGGQEKCAIPGYSCQDNVI